MNLDGSGDDFWNDPDTVDAYYKASTGGTPQQAQSFIQGNVGDTERLFAPTQGGQSVFSNTPEQPAAPTPTGGGGGGGGSPEPRGTSYSPPPMIQANGQVPSGMPYSPDPHGVALQNAALQRVLTEQAYTPQVDPQVMALQKQVLTQLQDLLGKPAIQPFQNPFQANQDALINRFLTQPAFGPEYINQLNEQQKELQLAREQAAVGQMRQGAAGRGTAQGGALQAGIRRAGQDTSRNLLDSHRSISLQTEQANRDASEQALGVSHMIGREREDMSRLRDLANREALLGTLGMSGDISGRIQDRDMTGQLANRNALLEALGISNSIYGGREDRGLNVARLMETIRQYDNDLLNRQSEFGASLNFNYDTMNNSNEQFWLNYLDRLSD